MLSTRRRPSVLSTNWSTAPVERLVQQRAHHLGVVLPRQLETGQERHPQRSSVVTCGCPGMPVSLPTSARGAPPDVVPLSARDNPATRRVVIPQVRRGREHRRITGRDEAEFEEFAARDGGRLLGLALLLTG